MLGGDPNTPEDWQLDHPADIDRPGIHLRYASTIGFSYYDGGPAGR